MFVTGTEGIIPYVKSHPNFSTVFKEFLYLCLQMEPERRSLPSQLLEHPFLQVVAPKMAMENVLKEIFLSNAFENSGLFL